MKFTHFILKHLVPEWEKLYLNFRVLKIYLKTSGKLKKLLLLLKKTRSEGDYRAAKAEMLASAVYEKMKSDNEGFIDTFRQEIIKVERFIEWKWCDLKMKLCRLRGQVCTMRFLKEQLSNDWTQAKQLNKSQVVDGLLLDKRRDLHEVEMEYEKYRTNRRNLLDTFYIFHNECRLFDSYIQVNMEGIRKILKKYKKQMIKGVRQKRMEKYTFGEVLNRMSLVDMPSKIKSLMTDIEQEMIMSFYPTKAKYCRQSLRREGDVKLGTLFAFGFFMGFALVCVIIILFIRAEGYLSLNHRSDEFQEVFPSFRGLALLLLQFWIFGLDVWLWNYFRINYKIYLGFNYHFSSLTEILKRACVLSAIYLSLFLLYVIQRQHLGSLTLELINHEYLPSLIWGVVLLYLVVPTKTHLNGEGRRWLWSMVKGAILLVQESRYTFFLEQFTSMIVPIGDLIYTICCASSDEDFEHECTYSYRIALLVACCLPYTLLILQNRNIWNFIQYVVSMGVGVLGYIAYEHQQFRYYWMGWALIAAAYNYWIDISRDWITLNNKHLRHNLGYNSKKLYYLIIVFNIFLRLIWTITVSPTIIQTYDEDDYQLSVFICGIAEIARRFIYNFLKIEKEHLNNQYQLKSVRDYNYPFPDDLVVSHAPQDRKSKQSISTVHRGSEREYPESPQQPIESPLFRLTSKFEDPQKDSQKAAHIMTQDLMNQALELDVHRRLIYAQVQEENQKYAEIVQNFKDASKLKYK